MHHTQVTIAKNMKSMGMNDAQIALAMGLSESEIGNLLLTEC